jgi:hypothetical protein
MTMNAKLGVAARLLVLTTLVLLPVAGCGGARTTDFNIVLYTLPGCSHCAQMTTALRGLEDEFPGVVRTAVVDASQPQTARMVRNLEFGDHGVVVRGRRGEVLYKMGAHQGGVEDVRGAIRQLIAQQQASL